VSAAVPACQTSDAADVVRLLAAGDPGTWDAVVRRYTRLLRHVCGRYRLTAEQTDDVCQVTWTALYVHAGRIRNADALTGWLVTTATRECLAVRRREWREVPTDDPAREPSGAVVVTDAEVDDRLDALPRGRRLHRAVALLPQRERALVELLLEPELPSYAAISRRLDMPVGAIGPVRQRAFRRLRAHLTEVAAEVAAEVPA
jgi:RNA polymerase sigma factor (sigma-70 family)